MEKHKITELKPQVRNPSRWTVVFDDGSVFGISEDVLLSEKLNTGDLLSDEEIEDLQQREGLSKAMNSAMHLLEFRMRSSSEIRQRLSQKGYAKELIMKIIKRLTEMEYLDDNKFALAFARDKVRNRKIGPVLLRQELLKHRLEPELVASTIDRIYREFPANDLIEDLIQKKTPDGTKAGQRSYSRVKNHLLRKGFTWDQIRLPLSVLKET